MTVVRPLPPEMRDAIIALRVRAYSHDNLAAMDPARLAWNDVDSASEHFGAFREGRLVSVLRATLIDSPDLFRRVLLFDPVRAAREHRPQYPVAALARAATAPEAKGSGCHSRLRHEALRWARLRDVQQVWGTMPAGSLRQASLSKLGYEIFANEGGWPWLSPSDPKPLLLKLDLGRWAAAQTRGLSEDQNSTIV